MELQKNIIVAKIEHILLQVQTSNIFLRIVDKAIGEMVDDTEEGAGKKSSPEATPMPFPQHSIAGSGNGGGAGVLLLALLQICHVISATLSAIRMSPSHSPP